MPIPKPNAGETQKEFIQRCMSDKIMINDFNDRNKRFAVCSQIYKDEKS